MSISTISLASAVDLIEASVILEQIDHQGAVHLKLEHPVRGRIDMVQPNADLVLVVSAD